MINSHWQDLEANLIKAGFPEHEIAQYQEIYFLGAAICYQEFQRGFREKDSSVMVEISKQIGEYSAACQPKEGDSLTSSIILLP